MPGRPGPRHPGVPGQWRCTHPVHRIRAWRVVTAAPPPESPPPPAGLQSADAAPPPEAAPPPDAARRPPEGYLGSGARITSGPAPELVEAGYALEIADAPLLHRGLTLADLAHLAELVTCGALRADEAAPLCTVLLDLLDS